MQSMISKKLSCLLLSVLSLFAICTQAQNISIATGGTGGVYYPMGGGLAAVLSKYVPNMQATAEVTGGTVDNINLVGSGKPYLGFGMTDAAQDAYTAKEKFVNKKQDIRALLVLYPNRMHVATVESTGIKTMADLKGKHISTGSPGSATEVMAFRLLEAAGLDKDKDVKRERLGVAESVNAIKDRLAGVADWITLHGARAIQNKADANGWARALARDRRCHHRQLNEARAVRFSAGEEAVPLDFKQGACGTGLLAGHSDPPAMPHLGPLI